MIAGQEYKKLDWWLIIVYITLTLIGWVNIFSAVYDEEHATIFDLTQKYGMQFIWIVTSYLIAFTILFIINPKAYSTLAFLAYLFSILLLVSVIFLGIEINGSKSWFEIGPLRFQPAELSKVATSLMLASIMSKYGFQLRSIKSILKIAIVLIIPATLIVMQKETGSALVYAAFFFMFYREGMSSLFLTGGILAIILFLITVGISPFIALLSLTTLMIIIRGFVEGYPVRNLIFLILFFPLMLLSPRLGELSLFRDKVVQDPEIWLLFVISLPFIFHLMRLIKRGTKKMWYATTIFLVSVIFIFSVEFIFENILQPHQKVRIENLLGINVDLKGAGYNVHQSKIAIGSGGFAGKGFLNGTQTKYNFVPEQSTDFIFCTIGEEWGLIGSVVLIGLYLFLIIRIINSADKQKDSFIRIFGYSLASIIFMHFFINIGMTIGLVPVIGIPLPFVSYGGSSMWTFTIFLFIFIRLDLDRRS